MNKRVATVHYPSTSNVKDLCWGEQMDKKTGPKKTGPQERTYFRLKGTQTERKGL